jgi:hypothetical protein
MDQIDRAAIFENLCQRQKVRRDAGLPLLDIKQEYEHEVKVAYWKAIYERHGAQVRAELIAGQREKFGPDWGYSAGGWWWLNAMAQKVLAERYGPRT